MKTRRDGALFAEKCQRIEDEAYRASKKESNRAALATVAYSIFLFLCFPFGWFVVGPLMKVWFEWLSS